MKSLKLIAAGTFVCTLMACGSTNLNNLPQTVKDAFAKKFPNAKSVSWDMESKTEWEAEFKLDGLEYSANFANAGTWKETEHEIEKDQVPARVKESLSTNFKGYSIEETEVSETEQGLVYEFQVKKDGSEMEVAIDANGKVMGKEEQDEDNED